MGKAIVVGMAVVPVLVMTLCVLALAGVLFGAVIAPLIALAVGHLVSFVFGAFGLMSEGTIGKIMQVGRGGVGGFTAAQFKD